MDSPKQQLPKLPSERKTGTKASNTDAENVSSPTQVSHLKIQPSQSESVANSDTSSERQDDSATSSPVTSQRKIEEDARAERDARDEQIEMFTSLPPLPTSRTAEHLLKFAQTTTQFMNTFQASVDERLAACSEKIDRLEQQVCMLESRNKLEEGDNEEKCVTDA